jgi:hypothetical protein
MLIVTETYATRNSVTLMEATTAIWPTSFFLIKISRDVQWLYHRQRPSRVSNYGSISGGTLYSLHMQAYKP